MDWILDPILTLTESKFLPNFRNTNASSNFILMTLSDWVNQKYFIPHINYILITDLQNLAGKLVESDIWNRTQHGKIQCWIAQATRVSPSRWTANHWRKCLACNTWGETLLKDGSCNVEIRSRIATAIAAMTKLERIWKSNTNF